MAQLAAKIDAEARQLGRTIPLADLLIGVPALHFGYSLERDATGPCPITAQTSA